MTLFNFVAVPLMSAFLGTGLGWFGAAIPTSQLQDKYEPNCTNYARCVELGSGPCELFAQGVKANATLAECNATSVLNKFAAYTKQKSFNSQLSVVADDCTWTKLTCPDAHIYGPRACDALATQPNAIYLKSMGIGAAAGLGAGLLTGIILQIRQCRNAQYLPK
jgi:hypothetical protein